MLVPIRHCKQYNGDIEIQACPETNTAAFTLTINTLGELATGIGLTRLHPGKYYADVRSTRIDPSPQCCQALLRAETCVARPSYRLPRPLQQRARKRMLPVQSLPCRLSDFQSCFQHLRRDINDKNARVGEWQPLETLLVLPISPATNMSGGE